MKENDTSHVVMYDFNQDKQTDIDSKPVINETNESNLTNTELVINKKYFQTTLLGYSTPTKLKVAFMIIGLIGINIIASIISAIAMPFLVKADDRIMMSAQAIINFVCYLIIYIVFMLMIFLDKHRTYKKVFNGFSQKKPWLVALVGFAAIIAFQELFGLLMNLLPPKGTNSNQQGIDQMLAIQPVLMVITTVIFAPFVEEITYRAGFCDLIGKNNKWLGIILSAVIFGFIHFDPTPLVYSGAINLLSGMGEMDESLIEILQSAGIQISENTDLVALSKQYMDLFLIELKSLPIYIGSGVLLAMTYRYSGELSSSIIAHSFVNLFGMVIQLIQNGIASSNSGSSLFNFIR